MNKRSSRVQSFFPHVVSTLALVVALTGTAAWALERNSIGSAQLKPNAVRSSDIKASAVRAPDIASDAVDTQEIDENAVTPALVELPEPTLIGNTTGFSLSATPQYQLIAPLGSFAKSAPDSIVTIDWSGPVASSMGACVFQLRVDGLPGRIGTGEVFIQPSSLSVSSTALFDALAPGAHRVEIWVRSANGTDNPSACNVSPPFTGDVGQTVTVTEQAV